MGASAVFTAVLLLPDVPLLGRILGLPLFGVGGLFMAYTSMSRKAAFRVDETGVLLGGNPARYKSTTIHVPKGAPPLPGDGPRARAALSRHVPVPADVALSSRAVNGWRLDRDRLVVAATYFAPGIPVRDHP